MKLAFSCLLRTYAIFDVILSPFSAIGWYNFWKLSRIALFIQRYEILRQSTEPLVEATFANLNGVVDEKLIAKQRQISEYCGMEPYRESVYQSYVKFEDTILIVLTPSIILCCLAMFGFFLGGILLMATTIVKGASKILGITFLIAQIISIVILLTGCFLTLDARLCAIEFVYNIRLFLFGSVFVVIVLYKVYEIVATIHYIREQSRIAQENMNGFTPGVAVVTG